MTIAIGVNFGKYVLLAADSRTTNHDLSLNKVSFSDESEKIAKTKLGLITGAGNSAMLDAVKNRLSKEEVMHSNKILKIIHEEKSNLTNILKLFNWEVFRPSIESTGWIFTYLTQQNKKIKLRLAIYHPSLGSNIGLYRENQPAVIYPYEASKKEADSLGEVLTKFLKPISKFKDMFKSIQYHVSAIGSFIDIIKPKYPSISSSCQFGIHALEGVWISPIIKPKTITKLSITFESK